MTNPRAGSESHETRRRTSGRPVIKLIKIDTQADPVLGAIVAAGKPK